VADASTVAIVSVAVTGATAVAAPLASGWLESRRESRRFERERITKDFDELRDLLDDIGVKLYTRTQEQTEWERAMADPRDPAPEGAGAKAREGRIDLYHLNTRLVIRLGREHSATKAFGRSLRVIDETLARMDAIYEGGEPWEQLAEGQDQRWRSYWDAYERYTDAAQQLVGARLGPVDHEGSEGRIGRFCAGR
jgi:hypothetical protein